MPSARGELLEQLGLTVEAHDGAGDGWWKRSGMKSVTNLIVRHRFGDGPVDRAQRARRRRAAWPRLARRPLRRHDRGQSARTGHVSGAASRCRNRTSPPTPGRCWRSRPPPRRATSCGERSNCTSPTTRRSAEIVGPKWLLDEGLTKPDAAIAAGFSYAIVTAHDGCLHLEVTVTGKQAHAAMPETGVDALEAANGILTALYAHRAALRGSARRRPASSRRR